MLLLRAPNSSTLGVVLFILTGDEHLAFLYSSAPVIQQQNFGHISVYDIMTENIMYSLLKQIYY